MLPAELLDPAVAIVIGLLDIKVGQRADGLQVLEEDVLDCQVDVLVLARGQIAEKGQDDRRVGDEEEVVQRLGARTRCDAECLQGCRHSLRDRAPAGRRIDAIVQIAAEEEAAGGDTKLGQHHQADAAQDDQGIVFIASLEPQGMNEEPVVESHHHAEQDEDGEEVLHQRDDRIHDRRVGLERRQQRLGEDLDH